MAALLAALAFCVLPVAYLAVVSLKSPDQVLVGTFLPVTPVWENWPAAFGRVPLPGYVAHSLLAAAGGAAVSLLVAVPAGYAIDRFETGGAWLPALALGSYVAPPVVALIPLFFLLRWVGLLNSLAGLVLVYGLANVPVALWLLGGFLRQVPRAVDEAAWLDGAGTATLLGRVIVPLLLPGLLTTGLICFILGYNEFLLASVFAVADAARTAPVGLSLFQGERLVNFGQMAAASLAAMLPVYGLGLAFQRRLVAGLTVGAVK